ncbi:unnamed protein product [Schistocephalus solidus]|uniref:DUF3362 domain-containing protein n=1 Tax=Schistocephalus solidus TaxID=70667 RepID=A0A183TKX4_SCHSO|nr:unnamed protein product [Schistocephalus solidus]
MGRTRTTGQRQRNVQATAAVELFSGDRACRDVRRQGMTNDVHPPTNQERTRRLDISELCARESREASSAPESMPAPVRLRAFHYLPFTGTPKQRVTSHWPALARLLQKEGYERVRGQPVGGLDSVLPSLWRRSPVPGR